MRETAYFVGALLQNSVGQFTKIISVKNGVYGLGGWTTRGNAEKQTVAHKFVNEYGLQYANAKVVSGTSSPKAKAKSDDNADAAGSTNTADDKTAKVKAKLKAMSAKEVKAYAEKLGVDNTGNRADVEKRIIAL